MIVFFRRNSLERQVRRLQPPRRRRPSKPGVLHIQKVFARKSGLGILVDVHREVDDNMTVLASYRLGHDVEVQVIQVLVRIEPHHRAVCEGCRPNAAPHW